MQSFEGQHLLSVDLDLPNAENIEGLLGNGGLSSGLFDPLIYESLKINIPKVTSGIVSDIVDRWGCSKHTFWLLFWRLYSELKYNLSNLTHLL